MRALLLLVACAAAAPAAAQTVVAAAPIRAGTVIEAVHLAMADGDAPGALGDMRDAIGLEARVNLYPDRPVLPGDLGMPTLIHRNEPVILLFRAGPLVIAAEGRALARAGAGETVRVLNTGSRSTVTGIAVGPGRVEVTR
ncbi:flagellar basal body P-ring formation chaperone FlgA [Jannaschia sp. W003]|nr:flagellar basal body P-ring formation chaperone FlgA [Jannaschia sp. W003]